jgi:dihydrolipoamide dehydrogenase
MMPSILPMVDSDISRRLSMLMKKAGIEIRTSAQITGISEETGTVRATMADGRQLGADKVLISCGRRFNTRGLGLEEAGVALGAREEITVNEYMRTNIPGIYAVGDVTNKSLLAHVASAQGLAAAQTIMGRPVPVNYDAVPSCIFTWPEIAAVGLTREAAEARGLKVKEGKFPFLASGKALCTGETEGMAKIIAGADDDRVLGVSIMGPHATELIGEGVLAVNKGVTAAELAGTIHAHPTMAEAVMEAAAAVNGLSIHQ